MGFVDNMMQAKSTKVVSSSGSSASRGGGSGHDDGDGGGGGRGKFKPPRVWCVRHYPPNCGPYSRSRPDGLAAVSSLSNGDDDSGFGLSATNVESLDLEPDSNLGVSSSSVINSVRLESCTSVVPDDCCDFIGHPVAKIESCDLRVSENLDETDILGELYTVKSKLKSPAVSPDHTNGCLADMPESVGTSLSESWNAAAVNEQEVSNREIIGSLPDSSKADVTGPLKETSMHKYPPRRKVSAVRHFPPNCGRNAKPPSKQEQEKLGAVEEVKDVSMDGGAHRGRSESNVPEQKHVKVHVKYSSEKATKSGDEVEICSGNVARVDQECGPDRGIRSHYQIGEKSNVVHKSDNKGELKGLLQPESVVCKAKVAAERHSKKLTVSEEFDGLNVASERAVVVGLMASTANSLIKVDNLLSDGSERNNNTKKQATTQEQRKSVTSVKVNPSSKPTRHEFSRGDDELDDTKENEKCVGSQLVRRKTNLSVNLTPFGTTTSKGSNSARKKVREVLRLFHIICRKLVHEAEINPSQRKNLKRVDCIAAKELKNRGMCLNEGQRIIGAFPGVEVGDEFLYRMELNIIGFHRQTQAGIDCMQQGQDLLAVSIVASGGYEDNLDSSDILDYTGHGGKTKDKEAEDQKLEKGNLALKNSIKAKNPVRVIRAEMKMSKVYVYDGLYTVEKYWQEPGPHGKLVFKFRMVRVPGQPELAWKQVKKSKKSKVREDLCVGDISQGKELIPICAVNTIDDEKPPAFKYITRMIYPKNLTPPSGCNCRNGCTESGSCSCVAKNDDHIPYNHNGAIVEAKDLVYECGPSCKCPPSCFNRASQHGIKFQLEIFKTHSRGWGVRSLNSISSGSFICEYVGELLEDNEAERRTNDEYLFDIGGHSDEEDAQDSNFTIDAAEFGNVGRFINHSCSPNLYAQNVLYDHGNRKIPHIMFFAAENIPPLRELTYHYNYQIDQVCDSHGNIKRKNCYCGSAECTGRMY
ncbi:unnamed protein product [Linum trigynum]|uniref:Uncharacterized protein n=1 Tax=Linum trigynum TaxID=586398 RepID=A0AAV2FTP9_9ROSI